MSTSDSTARSRELGMLLRRALRNTGKRANEAARWLGWSEARISRLLTGDRATTEVELALFLGYCGVQSEQKRRMLSLCRGMKDTDPFFVDPAIDGQTMLDSERQASVSTTFAPLAIPLPLQIPAYSNTVDAGVRRARTGQAPFSPAPRAVQDFPRHNGQRFEFLLHEFALHHCVGGPELMSAQLHELLRLSVRSYLTVRVIPAARPTPCVNACAFTLLDFEEFNSVVYLPNETMGIFLEEPGTVDRYRRIAGALDGIALTETESRELISDTAGTLEEGGSGDAWRALVQSGGPAVLRDARPA